MIVDASKKKPPEFMNRRATAEKIKENPLPVLADQYKRNFETSRYGFRREEALTKNIARMAGPTIDYQKGLFNGSFSRT